MNDQKNLRPNLFFDQTNPSLCARNTLVSTLLSWTLRCATEQTEHLNDTLYHYAKQLLCKCLFDNPQALAQKPINQCLTWQQIDGIDLWVEVTIDGENYALIIEIGSLKTADELAKHHAAVESHYKNSAFKRRYIHLTTHQIFKEIEPLTPQDPTLRIFDKEDRAVFENAKSKILNPPFLPPRDPHFVVLPFESLVDVVWNGRFIEDQKLSENAIFDDFWFNEWA